MNSEVKKEKISDKIGIYVNNTHRFGTDAVLLSEFAAAKHNDIVCDLCTGCGIVALRLLKFEPKSVMAVDIQKEAVELLQRSIEEFQLENVKAICGDLKSLEYNEEFTLITCNPPYKKEGTGIENPNISERIARHEVMCNINDICKISKKMLKHNGRLCLCDRPERLADVIFAMRDNNIEPKKIQFVSKNENSKPWLFLIEGKKNSKPFMEVLPQIYIKDGVKFSE
ncbi:MAG: methyltransferase [Oscillospiraceae bacterium]|jgi:tRNA1(Val) A37 N6-methylase TrmN6|nr:methyltransferase [Oscillospiraceae bacterium]